MASKGAVVIRFVGDLRDLNRSTVKVQKSLGGLSKVMAGGVIAGVGAVISSGVKLEKEFSQTMNLVAATTKAPAKEMKNLQNLAIKLGKDTSFSANEASTAMLELAKGGLSAADIKAGALKGTLQLASAGGLDLATASGIAANALNTFGLKGKDMATISAAMAGGANASTASVESLGMALSQVGPGARNAGLSINETVGALAAFDSAGIKGSDAGTSLKTMLTRLVPQTAKASTAMKKLGLDFTDSKGKFIPLTAVAQQLKTKLGGLSQEQRTTAMATIFGSDATRAATVLMNEGAKGLNKYINATKDRSAAEDMANARMKGTAGALERLSGSWETFLLTIGLFVAPAVQFLADRLGGLINVVTDSMGNIGKFGDEFKKFGGGFKNFGDIFSTKVLPALKDFGGYLIKNVLPILKDVWTFVFKAGQAIFDIFMNNILPVLKFVGQVLLNVGKVVVTVLGGMMRFVAKNSDLFIALGFAVGTFFGVMKAAAIIGTVVKFLKALTIANMRATVVQWAQNAAILANPYVAIIAGIIALVAAMVWFFTKTKTGQKIVKAVWGGIKAAIAFVVDWWKQSAWPNIKKGIDILGKVFKFYGMIVKFVWVTVVWGTLKRVWGWIKKNVIDRFIFSLKVWAAIFRFIAGKVSGYFSSMRDRLSSIGTWIRTKVFDRIGTGLRKLKDWFRNAKDGIGRIWDGLKSTAAKPVNFLIKWVWNNGLRKLINTIPGVKDLGEIPEVKFAKGGRVTGGIPGKDSVRAWLKPNEHVWTDKEVAAVGGHGVMKRMRAAALKGNLNGDPKFAGGGSLSLEDVVRGQRFARSQAGKPYSWGAVGPTAYDCSGFMSAITNVLNNAYPHMRRGSTGNFPWLGFERGPGQFTIGSTPNFGGSGVGHMAGTIGGLNVEARGSRGVLVGPSAWGATHSGFSEMAHLGRPGIAAMNDKSGGWFETIKDVLDAMRKLPGQISEMMAEGGWMAPYLKKFGQAMWSNTADFINNKIPDWGFIPNNPIPRTFDHGGVLRPGLNSVYNGLGRPEHLIRADENNAPIHVHIDIDGETVATVIVDPLRRKIKKATGGNVQAYLGRGK